MAVKLPWPVSVGLWFVESRGGDRFTSSFKEPMPVLDRIDYVGKMRGVKGIEMHLPYEATDENFEDIRKAARDNGLKIITVVPGLFNEREFKDGALISLDKKVREKAINRIKKSMEMNKVLKDAGEGGDFAIFWPAADGCSYNFTHFHPERRRMIVEGLVECLEETPGNIAIEHKPSDPAVKTYFGTTAEAILLCRDIIKQIGEEQSHRIGINP